MGFVDDFLAETIQAIGQVDRSEVERIAQILSGSRNFGGRLFILGSGGGAGHASHAVNDFRKLCAFEAYSPSDNVSELTARINDESWATSYREWLKVSRLRTSDSLLIFSVGGGVREPEASMNLVLAIDYAREVGSKVVGIVGRDGGVTAEQADACIVVRCEGRVTPQVEGVQAVLWHLLVTHPALAVQEGRWG